ncbi:hypothetical protein OSK38_26190, partial [Escherichia coli]|nr:hypothetical protein [Escherichia coli]
KKKLDHLEINKDIFSIARRTNDYYVNIEMGNDPEQVNDQKKKGNSFKWVCHSCNTIVRSTKMDVKILCGDCNEEFQLDD